MEQQKDYSHLLKSSTMLTAPLYKYMLSVVSKEPEVLKRLREETGKHPRAQMQISPDEGQFLSLLIKLSGAKNCIEMGVFTGYSSLSVALALPDDGKIIACDISEEFTNIAKKYWKEANVEHKIDLKLAPGIETLDNLIKDKKAETFDFAFIDADKPNYSNYYDRLITLIKKGGLIVVDNVLWDGKVIDESIKDADTIAIREFNKKVYADNRVDISMLAIGDGVTLLLKK